MTRLRAKRMEQALKELIIELKEEKAIWAKANTSP